jgi:hypothetical protein
VFSSAIAISSELNRCGNGQRVEMGYASTLEDIQESRDEAEFFRRGVLATMREPAPQPASVGIRLPPASIGEVRVAWTRAWERMRCYVNSCCGSVAIGCGNGAVKLNFETAVGGDGFRAELRIKPEDFSTVIRTMMLVNKQVALDAMKRELRRAADLAS